MTFLKAYTLYYEVLMLIKPMIWQKKLLMLTKLLNEALHEDKKQTQKRYKLIEH